MNGGWLLVVGFERLHSALWGWMSPIWGSSSASALWSPYSGAYVVFLCYGVRKVVCLLVAGGAIDLCELKLVCRCMCLWA
jgi:hypothetical protein